jgi:hypothetical protein
MRERILLQAFQLQQFSKNEIINMIPSNVLSEIKTKDPHPCFRLYSICHDGISSPKLLTTGKNEKIHWTKQAVQSMKNIIKKGIKFFHLHNKDNSTENRESLGEIIAHSQQEIDGKLHQLAIGYFPPETRERVKDYDVCSHEGWWEFIIESGKKIADKIGELTGIALSSSNEDTPAFSNTGLLGAVQCFEGGEPDNKGGGESLKREVKIMTLKDVIDYIVENNVHITQLPFDIEDIKADRNLGKIFNDMESEIKDLKAFRENAEKEKTEFETKIKNYEDKENLTQAKEKFNEILKTAIEKKSIGERKNRRSI